MEHLQLGFINRTAVSLSPQQPFKDWCISVVGEEEAHFIEGECKTYLLDDIVGIYPCDLALLDVWEFLFIMNLSQFTEDETKWPEDRSWEMFTEWFDVKFSPFVFDMGQDTVEFLE